MGLLQGMSVKTVKSRNLTWHYITNFGEAELNFLKKNFKFHPLDLKDCAGEIQRTKIDTYNNYLFLVFQLPSLDRKNNRVSVNQVYFFVGKNFLVTISKEKIKSLNTFFYKVINNQKFKEDVFLQDSGHVLYRALYTILRARWDIHGYLDAEIRHVEQDIDKVRGKSAVFEIASLRRVILQLKAIIDPQRLVTNALSRINVNFLGKDISVYFDDLDDFVEKNWFILEGYKDRILSLHEINESLVSYRTNNVMKILTVFSATFLPLTLLAGVYGMNVELPFNNPPNLIWFLFVILIITLIIIILIFKKKDWI